MFPLFRAIVKLVYAVFDVKINKTQPGSKIIRDFKNASIGNLKNAMEKVPLWVCNVSEDVSDSLYVSEELYRDVIHEHIKIRTAKVREKELRWVTRAINKAMNKRYKALRKLLRSKEDHIHKQNCRELRNNVTKMIREADNNYWKEQFNATATSADLWKVVKKPKETKWNERLVL